MVSNEGTMRTCHVCGTRTNTFCPTCVANFPNRRNAEEMTGDERAAEMVSLGDPLEIPFTLVHQRIEELVGRPVWTHEMAGWKLYKLLVEEARTRQHITFDQIVDKIPGETVVILTP